MKIKNKQASLTVEAALVLPIFLFFMMTFLYYIQIFTVQERIQEAITGMGFNLSRSAYVLKEFPDLEEITKFDFTIFEKEYDLCWDELAAEVASECILKRYAKRYLDTEDINRSCIKNGFDGISFSGSGLPGNDGYIDIKVSYLIEIPVKIFVLPDIPMIQRVKLRCWTGYEVAAAYETQEDNEKKEATVFITETGHVYHKSESCSHIKLSIIAVNGIPTGMRNDNGAKYYPCESCCNGDEDKLGTYYITSDGTRYHSKRDCSRIKRSVKEVPITEVGDRTPCKRCYK